MSATGSNPDSLIRKKDTGEPGNKGEFGLHALAPSGLTLTGLPTIDADLFTSRRDALTQAGYVPAVATAAVVGAGTTAHRKDWWDTHFVQAEYTDGDAYPQMPDDNTPGRTEGLALSGHRRTHRMAYRTGGLTLRMPSRTAINRYHDEIDGTFDVPVTASLDDGRDVQGWVRVTRLGKDRWATSGVGFPPGYDDGVSEAVSATLERRMSGPAPTEFAELIARRKARLSAQGIALRDVTSTWIASIGYDRAAGIMATMTEAGGIYGHKVSPEVFNTVASSHSPGAAFNKLVKGQPGVQLEQCPVCGRFKALTGAHVCPGQHKAPGQVDAQRQRLVREYAARMAGARPAPAPTATDTDTETLRPAPADLNPPAPAAPVGKSIDVSRALRAHQAPGATGPDSMYGPRGWTLQVADTIAPFTDELHEPGEYLFGDENGSTGLVRFSGLDADATAELADRMPRAAFADRQNNGPTLATMIAAANANPGVIELCGHVVGPGRNDERVTADGVYIYDDELIATQDTGIILRAAKDAYGLTDALRRPDQVSIVDVDWRGGRKAIYLWWS